jgi:hypothetical protein
VEQVENLLHYLRGKSMKEVFSMIPPANNKGAWIMASVALLTLGLTIFFAWAWLTMGKASFEVSEAGLRLRGELYGRLIPAQSLQVEQARIINLHTDTACQPRGRTFGTALPGYQAGWFRLQNGEKALVYLTDRSQVVYVPTTEGYVVMLSVPQPEALIASLRRLL